jgi:hypothetical protein
MGIGTGPTSSVAGLQPSIDTDDIFTALRLAAEGRLVLIDGPQEDILPG